MASNGAVAILYSTVGGFGDVGKCAVMHARRMNARVCVVAMHSGTFKQAVPTVTGAESTDITYPELHKQVCDALGDLSPEKATDEWSFNEIDVDDAPAAQKTLQDVLQKGSVQAVIACLASRQPELPRWLAKGASVTCAAMNAAGVQRLVLLSSMGIGDDFMPFTGIRVLWAFLLRTLMRSVHADLLAMEAEVVENEQNKCIDYLLVRPVGITPSEPPAGKWKILRSREDGVFAGYNGRMGGYDISKADVAQFMLQEALTPTLHRTAVTIGPAE
ncbi:hypothetical protein FVE85_6869 [Porphyridium purpureum]|uniref:NAD(P)-binding domain-containing protein n=1 Tax=Porphyridium purpureum TaxID=35688 RepID=A0A5J4Z8H8_PORPP|nr:hypothetical protein FVE85_6869 [Porphyridium purpureum]|eukprot:POR3650..scf295_1